ncbi:PorV/PorQ family protein [bacterium]|nr:PorV/PorQ family protein [bacterium]
MLLWLLALLPQLAAAEVEILSSASTAAKYLLIPAGARPSGLGNAFTAMSGDINALYWNPAGLLGISTRRIMLSHHAWISAINLEHLAYAQPVYENSVFGAELRYINFGFIRKWGMDAGGNPLPGNETYTPYVLAGKAGLAMSAAENISIGVGLQLAYDQIDTDARFLGSLDFGAQYRISRDLVSGLALLNVGIAEENRLLPMILKTGILYTLPCGFTADDIFILLADLNLKHDENPIASAGIEYTCLKLFQIRLGWNQNFGHTTTNFIGITGGAGIAYQNWKVDYALAPQGDMGISHKVSLEYEF